MSLPFQQISLVIALGNYGPEYELTRHNVAWLFVDSWKLLSSATWQQKFKGLYCQKDVPQKVLFLKPLTYMNLSGESALAVMQFYKITPAQICVIHDELDLNLGSIEFKFGGGLAGHNGLKSMAQVLGTQDFLRLRFGIGRPEFGSVSNWVLSNFSETETDQLEAPFKLAAEGLEKLLQGCALSQVQTQYNKKIKLK